MNKDGKMMIFCISVCLCTLTLIGIVSTAQETIQIKIGSIGSVGTNDTGPSPTTNPLIDWVIILGALSPVLASLVPIIKEWIEGRKWKKKYKKIETPSTILYP